MEDQNSTRSKEIKKLLTKDSRDEFHHLRIKPLKYFKSSLDRRFRHAIKLENDKTVLEKIYFNDQYKNLITTIEEIKLLPACILKLDLMQSFETCQLLVHEKGNPIGQNYSFDYTGEESFKTISLQNFNLLYNQVKKSKNKNFNLSEALKNDLNIIGNFLAKEIELKNHNVILIVSRNSFLLPEASEHESFNNLISFIIPVLNKTLDKEKNDLKKEILIQSLKHFPEKIFIKDRNSRVIFTNQKNNEDQTNLNLMSFPLEGSDSLTMELSNISQDSISADIYHAQRVILLGELLNTLSHELSNPLFGLNLTGNLLKTETDDLEIKNIISDICFNANRCQNIIKNFSSLYTDQSDKHTFNLKRLIEEVVTITKSETKEIRKELIFLNDEALMITANPTYLSQILFNFIINAAQAIKTKPMPHLQASIKIKVSSTANSVTIDIEDNGPGVGSLISSDIFKPFFTTKESGTGLGLSICKNLALQLGAEILFKNNTPLPGATFSINLPLK